MDGGGDRTIDLCGKRDLSKDDCEEVNSPSLTLCIISML